MQPTAANKQSTATSLVYAPAARAFHWVTVAFVASLVPLGLYMTWRGNATNFDALTARLYDMHKLFGFLLLLLVLARLVYRFRNGAPADEPTLEWWQKTAAHLTHWGLYALLLAIPLLGWFGVSYYDARNIFGVFDLPALAGKNQATSELVFLVHYWAAMLLALMIVAHIGAGLFHHFIRGDGVLRRMLPALKRRDNQIS